MDYTIHCVIEYEYVWSSALRVDDDCDDDDDDDDDDTYRKSGGRYRRTKLCC